MPVFIHGEMNGYEMFIHIAKVSRLGNKSELLDNWAQAALHALDIKARIWTKRKKSLNRIDTQQMAQNIMIRLFCSSIPILYTIVQRQLQQMHVKSLIKFEDSMLKNRILTKIL